MNWTDANEIERLHEALADCQDELNTERAERERFQAYANRFNDDMAEMLRRNKMLVKALNGCVEAMERYHPGDDEYWQAVEAAEAIITKEDEDS